MVDVYQMFQRILIVCANLHILTVTESGQIYPDFNLFSNDSMMHFYCDSHPCEIMHLYQSDTELISDCISFGLNLP